MPSGIVRALASCTRIDVEPKPARRRMASLLVAFALDAVDRWNLRSRRLRT
jgi:hypothetical protein